MNRYTKIKYNCRHTTYLIEKKHYGHLGVTSFLEMYIHLITCPFCRLYKKQTRVVAHMLRSLFSTTGESVLDETFKTQLQTVIEERMSGT